MSDKFYVNQSGADTQDASGSLEKPFATPGYALYRTQSENLFVFKDDKYELITASALKKAKKMAQGFAKKAEKANQMESEAKLKSEMDALKLEESKKIQITDTGVKFKKSTIGNLSSLVNERVSVSGWIHRLRDQKGLVFIVLRDGTGLLQCVLTGHLEQAYLTKTLTLESSVEIRGVLKPVPEGHSAPGGVELIADYYQVYGLAPAGDEAMTNKVQEEAGPSQLMDMRHLVLRGDTLSSVMKVRAQLLTALRKAFDKEELTEVTPPCMVQSMVEGGSTLFKFDYYGEPAYLTQSSQLYLETVVPALGDCYCIQESFRAEKSKTRRHLSEYTHVEAELGFLTFEDLLNHIERMITTVTDVLMQNPKTKALIEQLNPGFQPPKLPFRRMKYVDALTWLNDHGVINSETGEKFKFGDDIAEAEERRMTDEINEPIFLTHFPLELKSFYMARDKEDPRVTESVDCLLPNVGEVVGGSMRISDYDELMAAFKREKLDPEPYYWFIDLRKYGTFPHGGYGLGLERILAWICNRFTVRECVLYPRYTGRCKP